MSRADVHGLRVPSAQLPAARPLSGLRQPATGARPVLPETDHTGIAVSGELRALGLQDPVETPLLKPGDLCRGRLRRSRCVSPTWADHARPATPSRAAARRAVLPRTGRHCARFPDRARLPKLLADAHGHRAHCRRGTCLGSRRRVASDRSGGLAGGWCWSNSVRSELRGLPAEIHQYLAVAVCGNPGDNGARTAHQVLTTRRVRVRVTHQSAAELPRQPPCAGPCQNSHPSGRSHPETGSAQRDRAGETEHRQEPGDHRQRPKSVQTAAQPVEDSLQQAVEDQREHKKHQTGNAETEKPAHVPPHPQGLLRLARGRITVLDTSRLKDVAG